MKIMLILVKEWIVENRCRFVFMRDNDTTLIFNLWPPGRKYCTGMNFIRSSIHWEEVGCLLLAFSCSSSSDFSPWRVWLCTGMNFIRSSIRTNLRPLRRSCLLLAFSCSSSDFSPWRVCDNLLCREQRTPPLPRRTRAVWKLLHDKNERYKWTRTQQESQTRFMILFSFRLFYVFFGRIHFNEREHEWEIQNVSCLQF